MKILYVTQFFYPETAAAAIRAYENAKEWVKAGHDVTVLTAYPNFPTGRLFEGYTVSMLQEEKIEGIRVLRSKVIIRPNTNKIMRAIAYFSFSTFGLLNMLFNKKKIEDDYDIVLATSGIVFAPIIGYYYAKRKKLPFVVELRDITFRQILATGGSAKSLSYRIIKRLELFYCKKAEKIVVLTRGFKQELIGEGIEADKIEVITNGVRFKESHTENTPENGSAGFQKQPDEILFTYMGTMGVSQNLTSIIDLFKSLRIEGKKIRLLFIGDGAEKGKLIQYKDIMEIDNLTILDSLPQKALDHYYRISDFCLVVLSNNSHFSNTIPSKIFHIMIHKRPVLFFGPKGEAASIIEEAGAGLLLTDPDMRMNLETVRGFLSDSCGSSYVQEVARMSNNGYNYVKANYNIESLTRKYTDVMKSVLK